MTGSALRRCLRGWYPAGLVLVVTAALAVGILIAARQVADSRIEDEMREMREDARVSGMILRENTIRVLAQVTALHGLTRMVSEGRQTGDHAMEQAAYRELSVWRESGDGEFLWISAIRPDGYLDWALGRTNEPPVYLGDRDYFRRIARGETRSFVSETMAGRLSGRQVIQFAQGIYDAAGAFKGVTVVSLIPRLLWDLPGRLSFGPYDAMTVVRRDGTVIARNRELTTIRALPADSPLLRAITAQPSGTLRGRCPFDQRLRIGAFERVPGTDLILIVDRDVDTRLQTLAPTLSRIRLLSLIGVGMVVVLGGGLTVLLYVRRKVAAIKVQARLLQQSESLFRQMAEGLPDLVRLQDADGTVIYASPASREIVGIEPEALLGRRTGQYVHPDDHPRMITRAFSKSDPPPLQGTSEVRILRPDGGIVWVQTNMRTITMDTGEGTATRIVSVSRDITRQRGAEDALRHAKQELDALLTASRSALLRVRLEPDGQLRLTFASANLVDVIGFTPEEAIANPDHLARRRDPAFRDGVRAYFRQLMSAGTSMTKYPFRHKNGHWIWISVWASRTADEDCPTAVGFVTDITRQQRAEIQLMQHNKLAMLGEMSTSIAHELNQPLTVIGLTADGILAMLERETPELPALRSRMLRIIEQVDRAATIVRHMRVFGRKADGPPVPVSVSRAIEGALAVVTPRLERETVRTTTQVAPDLPPVRGYLVLLEQVLVNLIDNALQAAIARQPPLPPERRRIEIAAWSDGATVEITVADHAGGIDAAALPRVFEPFFTTKPDGQGTGLSISYGIISDMGGRISAENVGDGAVLTIRLPATAPAHARDRAPEQRGTATAAD